MALGKQSSDIYRRSGDAWVSRIGRFDAIIMRPTRFVGMTRSCRPQFNVTDVIFEIYIKHLTPIGNIIVLYANLTCQWTRKVPKLESFVIHARLMNRVEELRIGTKESFFGGVIMMNSCKVNIFSLVCETITLSFCIIEFSLSFRS